jgi:flagellar motility protein MotE (MotC chaperone)
MNGIVKPLIYGLAAFCVVIVVAGVVVLAGLKSAGKITPEKIRDFLLSPEEKSYLVAMRERTPEAAPLIKPAATIETGGVDQERMLADLAEMANARHANALVEELRRRKDAIDERERWIEAREGELRSARTDLARLARQLENRRTEINEAERIAAEERARFAVVQAGEQSRVSAMKATERARYRELAKLYELQKADAWLTLRKLAPNEVARVINEMEPKKAAAVMRQAEADAEFPMAVQLHRELMGLDPDGDSAAQLRRLAGLYQFMKPDQIIPLMRNSPAREVADLLRTMAEIGVSDSLRAGVLSLLAKEDETKAREVTNLLQPPAAAQPKP